jgi:ABC-2 type transport system permease protein
VFFGFIFSGFGETPHGMRIAIADEDGTERSRAFVKMLDDSPELDVVSAGRQEAVDLVRRGKCTAYLVLPPGFGESREHMFQRQAPELQMGTDPSRAAEAGMLKGVLAKYAYQSIQDAFTDPKEMRKQLDEARAELPNDASMDPELRRALLRMFDEMNRVMDASPPEQRGLRGWEPFKVKSVDVAVQWEGPKRAFDYTFPQAIMWGMLACTATFSVSLVTERRGGTLMRLRTAPLSRWRILAGKGAACFVMTAGIAVLLLAIGVVGFRIRPSSYPLLALAVLCSSLCFCGIMMFLSVLGRTERSAGGIGWAVLMIMSMFGGGMLPLFIMPSWMRAISYFSPIRWGVYSLEGSIWRGLSAGDLLVPCGMLVGVGAAFFAVGARAFRWTD